MDREERERNYYYETRIFFNNKKFRFHVFTKTESCETDTKKQNKPTERELERAKLGGANYPAKLKH